MSEHGGIVVLKGIREVAEFQRNLIPSSIPDSYAVKPVFDSYDGDDVRAGVAAFRDFLYIFCDRLISVGNIYAKAPNKPKSVSDYPFLANVTNILVEIGYLSELSDIAGGSSGAGSSLLVSQLPSCTPVIDENGKKKNPKINGVGLIESLQFLSL